ncbi:hypothetical protein BRADI_4g26119v3 [Brachypodium distachyon]|uniref:DUF4220 domain-containing protein n=1 Tax=Brachypodium distachyon TaxID=15368 RepID=A0A2K2CQB2_BRADI|nr:hypothetical protein BRADI_4g26119v3 [Brachypodium distachyon]
MESLVQIFNEWQIQLLVLLSFTLQVFLFFTGGLRWRSTDWYMVAIYALGFLSRHHKEVTPGKETLRQAHPLAFLWAPFLLMHLGGQDTVTAFAIEDNNLWLRHLLNLVVQVAVALYVFWVSMTGRGDRSVQLPGIFVFIAGVIKYGERTLAQYGRREVLTSDIHVDHLPKLLEIELDLMYDDIYTKAMVLRTRSGIIFRCVSQASMVVGFVLFIVGAVNNKHGYSRADLAITYVLFTGGLCMEVCAVFILLMSPWTWAWLKARNNHGLLACISSFLLSSNIGRPERRPLWSNSMGQYNFLSYVSSDQQSRLYKFAKKVVAASLLVVGAGKKVELSLFLSMSKLLESDHERRKLPYLGPLLAKLIPDFGASFGYGIVCFHIFTEAHLRKYTYPGRDHVLVSACRKLSNYMLYLLATHPEMLPVSGSIEALVEMRDLWTTLLIFSAGKSRADVHAAQLSRGGELLTFAWLLMAHRKLGDVGEAYNFNLLPIKPGTS